jgi:predicted DNA-binding transcriptional regulator AlpA
MSKTKQYSTAHVAKLLGISKRTLLRCLYAKAIPEPEWIEVGKLKARVWSEADVKQARVCLVSRRANFDTFTRLNQAWQAFKAAPSLQDDALLSPKAAKLKRALTKKRLGPRPTNLATGDEILTPQQLARRLQLPVSWVYEQTRNRANVRNVAPMPHIKMGKYLRFSWQDVVRWMDVSLTKKGAN